MSPKLQVIDELIARVILADGPDPNLDAAIQAAVMDHHRHPGWASYSHSRPRGVAPDVEKFWLWKGCSITRHRGAALDFCDRVLPRADWQLSRSGDVTILQGQGHKEMLEIDVPGRGRPPALVIVEAVLRVVKAVLIEEGE